MQEYSLQRRIDFATILLSDLKNVHNELAKAFSDIKKSSGCFYENFLNDNKDDMDHEVEKYKENIQKTNQLNYEITEKINIWYDFVKNPKEMKKIFFPVKFYMNKRELKNNIKKNNNDITSITLENRFIMEKLIKWESELELKAVQQIKQENDYQVHEQLIQRKAQLISDLEYIFSTLPLTYPVKVDVNDIDSFIEKLKNIPAA